MTGSGTIQTLPVQEQTAYWFFVQQRLHLLESMQTTIGEFGK
jgi:hypothetical protein